MNSNNKENKTEIGTTTTTTMMMMMIVIRPIRSTYRMYVRNKRSGSSLCLRERKLAHFVGINIMGGMGADCQQQQQQRKQIGTTTTMMMIVIQTIRSTYRMKSIEELKIRCGSKRGRTKRNRTDCRLDH